jgi:hypothetical protein
MKRPARQSLDLADERRNIDGSFEEPAPLVRKRVFRSGKGDSDLSKKDDVDPLRIGQVAKALDRLERTFGIRIDQDHTRPLHCDTREQHRHGYVDDDVARGAECFGDSLRLGRGIAHEDRWRRASHDLVCFACASRHDFVLPPNVFVGRLVSLRLPLSEEYPEPLSEPRQERRCVDENEDERRQAEFSTRHSEDHSHGSTMSKWGVALGERAVRLRASSKPC